MFPGEDLEFRHRLATPEAVYFRQEPRDVLILRNVVVWPETSLVFTRKGGVDQGVGSLCVSTHTR